MDDEIQVQCLRFWFVLLEQNKHFGLLLLYVHAASLNGQTGLLSHDKPHKSLTSQAAPWLNGTVPENGSMPLMEAMLMHASAAGRLAGA